VAQCAAVDAIGIGEGEVCLPELLSRLGSGAALRSFPGMWIRDRNTGFSPPVPPPAPARDIAALPAWDYEVLGGIDRLLNHSVNIFGDRRDRFLPRRASRGCPYDCTYCSAPRWRSAAGYDEHGVRNVWPVDDLCRDLADIRDRHAPDGFEFWDEHFPVDLDWLKSLAREYPRRVGLPFRAEMHPSAATRERLELLAAAGCELFHCGVEEGDPSYRRNVLHRRSSDTQLLRVFDDARSLGMRTSASVMVACPGETAPQIESTLALLRRLRPDHLFWSKYTPLPGTILGDQVEPSAAVELEHFDDFRHRAPLADSRSLDDREHSELFARFDALKRELLGLQASVAATPPPVDVTSLTTNLGNTVPGWSIAGARHDHGVLLVDLGCPGGRLVLQVVPWRDGARSFTNRDGLAYSYQGTADRATVDGFGRVIEAIHPATLKLIASLERS
jgi:radical SAM superfamily enzyme YgiQ (UPF0313 family)